MAAIARQLGLPSSLIVIPARLHSTRLPRKLLLRAGGKTVIQYTYEAACRSKLAQGVIVATDAEEIAAEVLSFGGASQLTGRDLQSGTDRVAEVAATRPDIEIFVNVQGDEPELAGETIDRCIRLLHDDPQAEMATLATPIRCLTRLNDPACVKVVCDDAGRALYFSRSPIPHAREWSDHLLTAEPAVFHQHLGIYAYRREFLLRMAAMPPAPLEQIERLEQLRALSAGVRIAVGVVHENSVGIDTPADYELFVQRVHRKSA